MWTRAQLKEKAKFDMKRSYWGVVLMSLILAILGGGSSGGSSAGSRSGSSLSDEIGKSSGDIVNPALIVGIIIAVLVVVLIALVIGFAIAAFVTNPVKVGAYRYFVEATYEEKTVSDMKIIGHAFRKGIYGNVVKTMILKDIYQFLWGLLFIIPGIVKGYEYRMIPYILAENPELDSDVVFSLSKEMMNGEKWKAFVLDLSFIGWIILSICTCGILSLFYVSPYINMTDAHLYKTLKKKASINYFDSYLRHDYEQPVAQIENSFYEQPATSEEGNVDDTSAQSSPYQTYTDITDSDDWRNDVFDSDK